MKTVTLTAQEIVKKFNRRSVLQGISFVVSSGESIAITGKNGSGKSTLVKIVAGVLSATSGKVEYKLDGKVVGTDAMRGSLGFVSPYLQMYDEFSALENVNILSRIRDNAEIPADRSELLFRKFGLWHRRDDFVRTFSSGMKQRLKYIVALAHEPSVLILDEPGANLDEEGVLAVHDIVENQRRVGILLVATNEEREAGWCEKRIHVGG